jgi:serine protease Do
MSERPVFPLAKRVVKALAIVVGGLLTFVSLMAVVGVVSANGYVRVIAALILAIALPAFVADRLLPKNDTARARGLVSDVFALTLLGFAFLFCGIAQPLTRKLLVAEGDRLAASGFGALARVAYLFGGVRPEFPLESPPVRGAALHPSDAGTLAASPAVAVDAAPPADASAPAAAAGTAEETPAQLFKEWAPSVVCIQVAVEEGEGGGTGFAIDDSGTIATNQHVIRGAKAVKVKLFSGKWIEQVDLLTEDHESDLALLRVKTSEPLNPVSLGDSDAVTVGERIIAIGNPLGLEYTLTDGLVSSRRILEGKPMIQMSVPVSPGNSGGPVINVHGQVVGVTTLQITGGFFGRAQNLNMAVPIKALRALIKPEYPERRSFGGDSSAASTW